MSELKQNLILKKRLLIGGLIFTSLAASYQFGKVSGLKNANENEMSLSESYLEEYILKRDNLEKELEIMETQKNNILVDNSLLIKDLLVVKITVDNNDELYIVKNYIGDFFHEYRNLFEVYLNSNAPERSPEYIHTDMLEPLINYLTEEEIQYFSSKNGVIYQSEIDQIFKNINEENYIKKR